MSLDMDIEHRLDEIEEKVDKSYTILRAIRRKQTFELWFGIIKIGLLLGSFYYAYAFLQPYFDQVKQFYSSVQSLSDSAASIKAPSFMEYLKR